MQDLQEHSSGPEIPEEEDCDLSPFGISGVLSLWQSTFHQAWPLVHSSQECLLRNTGMEETCFKQCTQGDGPGGFRQAEHLSQQHFGFFQIQLWCFLDHKGKASTATSQLRSSRLQHVESAQEGSQVHKAQG